MNTKTRSLIAAAALALAGSAAFAADGYASQPANQPLLSRADVTAELIRARRSGEITQTATPYSQVDAALRASRQATGRDQDARQQATRQPGQPQVGE